MKKPEYIIVLAVIACSVALALLFSSAIGKFSFGSNDRTILARFKQVDGVGVNTTVKYAGAPVGRVSSVKVIPREERDQMPAEFHLSAIEVGFTVSETIELTDDITVSIKQDGMLGPKYIAITPGKNPSAPPLPPDEVLLGKDAISLDDLYASGQTLIEKIIPMTERLENITVKVDDALPGLIVGIDTVLDDSDQLLSTINTPENNERIQKLLTNLSQISNEMNVVMANMKVVSSNAKALTLTLAQTPWRLVWGGVTNPPVPEQDVLRSDQPIPIDNVIEVNRPTVDGETPPGSPAASGNSSRNANTPENRARMSLPSKVRR